MVDDVDALRLQFIAAMTAAPMGEYALDSAVQDRVGKFFTKQADDAERVRRFLK
jgi:hypothetical protein